MIKTVADLLNNFLEKEKQILQKHIDKNDLTHTTTIGDMFESLTQETLSKVVPFEGLVVGTGFIRGIDPQTKQKKLSRQIDCLLSVSEGEHIPQSASRIFDIEDVVAIVEVKKTLYKQQIEEGLVNIESVMDLYPPPTTKPILEGHRNFELVVGRPLPSNLDAIPESQQQVFRLLDIDAVYPVRILFGYDSYASEFNFRKGLLEYLTVEIENKNLNLRALPNLILGPAASAVKLTGIPWNSRLQGDRWPFMATTSTKPAILFLESLWTRLINRGYGNSRLFGEDLAIEIFNPFLDIEHVGKGWKCRHEKPEVDEDNHDVLCEDWQPEFVSENAFTLANILCKTGGVDVTSEPEKEEEIREAAEELHEHGVAGFEYENENMIRLITRQCGCWIFPDGRLVVGENNTGRLERWVFREIDRLKKQKAEENADTN